MDRMDTLDEKDIDLIVAALEEFKLFDIGKLLSSIAAEIKPSDAVNVDKLRKEIEVKTQKLRDNLNDSQRRLTLLKAKMIFIKDKITNERSTLTVDELLGKE